jgi:CRP/FNR family cyclic AMP-dependent transcriptional regulator
MAAGLPKTMRISPEEFDPHQLLEQAARQDLPLRTISYPMGAFIFGQGDLSEKTYVILEGLVKVAHIMADGKRFSLRLLKPGDLLGRSALTGTVRRAYAQALKPTRLLILKPKELSRLVSRSEELTMSWITALSQEVYEFQVRLLAAARGGVQEQLVVLLWFLQKRFGRSTPQGTRLELKLPCQLLAEMLGHSRQRVNEALGKLKQQGLVQAHYGQIVIKNLEGLRALAKPFLDAGGGGRKSVPFVTDFLSRRGQNICHTGGRRPPK